MESDIKPNIKIKDSHSKKSNRKRNIILGALGVGVIAAVLGYDSCQQDITTEQVTDNAPRAEQIQQPIEKPKQQLEQIVKDAKLKSKTSVIAPATPKYIPEKPVKKPISPITPNIYANEKINPKPSVIVKKEKTINKKEDFINKNYTYSCYPYQQGFDADSLELRLDLDKKPNLRFEELTAQELEKLFYKHYLQNKKIQKKSHKDINRFNRLIPIYIVSDKKNPISYKSIEYKGNPLTKKDNKYNLEINGEKIDLICNPRENNDVKSGSVYLVKNILPERNDGEDDGKESTEETGGNSDHDSGGCVDSK